MHIFPTVDCSLCCLVPQHLGYQYQTASESPSKRFLNKDCIRKQLSNLTWSKRTVWCTFRTLTCQLFLPPWALGVWPLTYQPLLLRDSVTPEASLRQNHLLHLDASWASAKERERNTSVPTDCFSDLLRAAWPKGKRLAFKSVQSHTERNLRTNHIIRNIALVFSVFCCFVATSISTKEPFYSNTSVSSLGLIKCSRCWAHTSVHTVKFSAVSLTGNSMWSQCSTVCTQDF